MYLNYFFANALFRIIILLVVLMCTVKPKLSKQSNNVLTALFIIFQKRMKKTTPELHDVTTLPDPDVQIIEEKSSSSMLLSSMGVSDASIKNLTSHDCITELEHIIATQEADAKKAKDEFEKNLMLTILVQKKEMIQLRNK